MTLKAATKLAIVCLIINLVLGLTNYSLRLFMSIPAILGVVSFIQLIVFNVALLVFFFVLYSKQKELQE